MIIQYGILGQNTTIQSQWITLIDATLAIELEKQE